jgi:tetratricopeptide (TPR) repeat protein
MDYGEKGELDKAIADYTEAIRVDQKLAQAYYGRAHIYCKKGEFDKAIGDYTQAIRFHPKDADGYYRRGMIYADKGEFGKAIADCEESIRLDPNNALACNATAWLQATCPDPRFRDRKGAIENAKRACELTGEKDDAYIDTLAAAYAENGDFQNACKWQTRAIELTKDEQYKKEYRSRLQLFEKRQPYREEKKKR